MAWIDQLQSANWNQVSGIALGAYILGCFTTGYYYVRWRTGQDIRELGSGSVGARNAGRILGWRAFLITLLGDFAKGIFAVWATQHYTTDYRMIELALLAVVAGHVWPAQLRFHGGKGIATSLGALLVYDYHLAFTFLVLFAIGFATLRKTVLPGLFAFACLPLASTYLYWGSDPARVVSVSALAALILITHRKNLTTEFSHFLERRNANPKPHQHHL
jgi:acyl phosphate:glycerol-3-phosphate acyltransferase